MKKNLFSKNKGFTLIESIIAIGIFLIIATGIYFSYSNILDIFSASYLNLTALTVLDSEFELIRNMSYPDVGIQNGSPAGVIPPEKIINYSNLEFLVRTSVRNVDDPFDGLQGGNPNDTSPADYKLVEIEVVCPSCPRYIPAKANTTIAPPGLESVTNNGTLIIRALNASGQPVAAANVSIINNNVTPNININDVTDASGILRLVDIATSSAGYAITVSRTGYSTDRTYQPGDPLNPNPLKPHATVLEQQTTEISFVIDLTSTINFRAQNNFCVGTPNMDFIQTGQKTIGTNPVVAKYSVANSSNASGIRTLSGLEFDTYDFAGQDATYEVSGFGPQMPVVVNPAGTYSLTWLTEPKTPSAIVVSVEDQNGQRVNDAEVTLSRAGFSEEKYSGRKFIFHTDWSGGQYDSKSPYLETSDPGRLRLGSIGSKYASMSDEWLTSQTIDFGTSDTNFYNLSFSSVQPGQTSARIQLASNNDNATWNFVGPDGTALTYYTATDTQIHSSHNGDRYFRYKVILRTENDVNTPEVSDITINFHSVCIPDGQAYFSGLTQDTYTVRVERTGFQTFTDNEVIIDQDWEDYRVILSP